MKDYTPIPSLINLDFSYANISCNYLAVDDNNDGSDDRVDNVNLKDEFQGIHFVG